MRIHRKVARRENDKVVMPSYPEIENDLSLNLEGIVDWIKLPYDTVTQLLSSLNYRDRASLSSTCRTWRGLGISPCLWQSLDLRAQKCDAASASSLASRCANLEKLQFRGAEAAEAIINLQARDLREISGDNCGRITDATICMIAARHEALESLVLGPDFCKRISSNAIRSIAICCPKLKTLRLSGIHDVDGNAINALAKHCQNLMDLGFIDCLNVDEVALGNVVSLRFLSVSGTRNMRWGLVLQSWTNLPNLAGLDVSRTTIHRTAVWTLLSSLQSLKVLCALHCPALEEDASFLTYNTEGKLLVAVFTNIFKGLAFLFADITKEEKNVFSEWRNLKKKDKNLDEIMTWLEWIISHSLLRITEGSQQLLNNFWVSQGAALLVSLLQSSQEDVQERAATGLATFVVKDGENAGIDGGRAEAVMRHGGIPLLLNVASSWQEGLQSAAAKAIANLSANVDVAKAVAKQGGINILANLARSTNRSVAEEAAGGLWNLSVGEEPKDAISDAGVVKALVDLIFKWSSSGAGGVLERATGALANLVADDKCSKKLIQVGGLHALVMLARDCKLEGVQEQAARALANLAAHADSDSNDVAFGEETGALEALVQLTRSTHEGVRQEAAGALWNLSFNDRNPEAIAAAGGVEALVALAQSCINASQGLQERAAGALWGLSVSEANSIAIGHEGGVAPLIAFACSDTADLTIFDPILRSDPKGPQNDPRDESTLFCPKICPRKRLISRLTRAFLQDVHETAAGALWNLAFHPGNALRIVEEGGVPALVQLCSSSTSRMARFMAALALAYMFDGRMDELALIGMSTETTSKGFILDGASRMALEHIEAFVISYYDPHTFAIAAASSAPAALTPITELAQIHEASHLRCCQAEIRRLVSMLRHPSSILKTCAVFALLQFTVPGGQHTVHHVKLLQNVGAPRVLRATAAATTAPLQVKIFARIVLRNLEFQQMELQPN
ncbi:protein ARABIDILLO 1-like isoform X2 [Actinidia eriantha]|uniref:protein ARABIDILLO 1-like isoform X2 n=1 Tax=Actinidia eriantha TaxID=165200 RepID=UPI0025894F1E|nr:protein ARABIDILLO 1-like isoform X2 [Actinidia eriantha]XP_057498994.1 protein ARABIDILLO 1-like isoform X2 [Actinidia eriantha]